MVVLHTCKNEEDPIKNEDARVLTRLYDVFFIRSRAANSEVSGGCPRYLQEDPIKNEGAKVLSRFSLL